MSTPQKKQGGWGNLFTQAVAGVESRLDNILFEEEAVKKSPEKTPTDGEKPCLEKEGEKEKPSTPPARSNSSSRQPNDRLQERLARALAAKNVSRNPDAPRNSTDNLSADQSPRASVDSTHSSPAPAPGNSISTEDVPGATSTPTSSGAKVDEPASPENELTANPRILEEKSTSSLENKVPSSADEQNSSPAATGLVTTEETPTEPVTLSSKLHEERIADLERTLQETQVHHAEELNSHVERVDALQSKLQYFARDASEQARNTAAMAPPGSLEKKLAERDDQVAQLMEEGRKLANTEQHLRSIVKKLRAQVSGSEKELNEQKQVRNKNEEELAGLRIRSKELDEQEALNQKTLQDMAQLKRSLEKCKAEAAQKESTISSLRAQLREEGERSKAYAAKANDDVAEVEKKRARQLEESIASLEIEKDLAADRAKAQATDLREKADRATERSRAIELEMKGELQVMESKLEAMRARAEEASTGATGDAHAKLLRQIETLQTQHAIASENWQGMEASLMARATSLEKERDEALRRESDIRKKARENAVRAKRQEEELEDVRNQLPSVENDISSFKSEIEALRQRAEEAESSLEGAKADFEKQKQAWNQERSEKVESDRRPWPEDFPGTSIRNGSRPESPLLSSTQRTFSSDFLGLQVASRFRKPSAPSSNGEPGTSDRPGSGRRPSALPPATRPQFPHTYSGQAGTPPLTGGLEALASPPIHSLENDLDENIDTPASPKDNIQDVVSVSTVGAGPSVQLVERMSTTIRRLESEKVAAKEELARISSQRDEARGEIVTLMKEVEVGKSASGRVSKLEKEVADINERYQTTLEMLGEKSELVEELKADVQDVKAMYRDLVERTIK